MSDSLKERFDKAFYGLLDANKRLNEVAERVNYAGSLVEMNKAKQNQIKQMLKVLE